VEAQPELEPWGNLNGIRIEGQLMEVKSSLRVVKADGSVLVTGKERQPRPLYGREGKVQWVKTVLDSLYLTISVTEGDAVGMAKVRVSAKAHGEMSVIGTFLSFDFPARATIQWVDSARECMVTIGKQWVKIQGRGLTEVRRNGGLCVDVALRAETEVAIATGGPIDRTPVQLSLDVSKPGRKFAGLGGNFRIQNLAHDPQVIDYCLEHLPIAWGRVELPWRLWQPVKESSPLDSAKAGHMDPAVRRAVEMARRLGQKKIPLVVSAWFPPDWAAEGPVVMRPAPGQPYGNSLNKSNMDAIYKSIADYIVLLRDVYGVEITAYSFNESDIGINVRQTAQEHDELIKGLGAYFVSRGLKTKVLLGDNSDANTWRFIETAMADPAAPPYMAAVSFHSWRGWDSATLQKWADAATKTGLPLLVGEGSIDAAAWKYPAVFKESSYALREIGLYTLLLGVCQPESILQWQLTSDYSPLAGGGIFGDTSALHPTQRFWNLKQLSMTPPGLFAMPLSCDRPNMTVAGLGDRSKGVYTVHVVNTGAARNVILRGLPASVRSLRIYTTNSVSSVEEGKVVAVKGGMAKFRVAERSYVTVISE
jgi:hypothetical protein